MGAVGKIWQNNLVLCHLHLYRIVCHGSVKACENLKHIRAKNLESLEKLKKSKF